MDEILVQNREQLKIIDLRALGKTGQAGDSSYHLDLEPNNQVNCAQCFDNNLYIQIELPLCQGSLN